MHDEGTSLAEIMICPQTTIDVAACPWPFRGEHWGRLAEQESQTLDQFSTAFNPRREIEVFHDASKMCQISVFRCPSSASSSFRAFCRKYNESNQATSSGSACYRRPRYLNARCARRPHPRPPIKGFSPLLAQQPSRP